MESVNKRVIIIAIIMALVSSFLIYIYIKKATTSSSEVVEYYKVYVAAKTLPPRYKIAESDLKEIKVTKDLLNPKSVQNKAEIVGKRLRDSVIEGEQILRERLVDENKLTLTYIVPEGKRAVSVNVNEQVEVANLIKPGDYVDVIGSFEKEEITDSLTKTVYPRITKTILQNIQLLALGQEQLVTDDKGKELPKTVTLAVTPQDAEKLVYASEYAILRLALRPVDDKDASTTSGVIREELVPDKGVKVLPNASK